MVLEAKVKLTKSPNSATPYIAIPTDIVKDSQFPFQHDEKVDLRIRTEDRTLVVSGADYRLKMMGARAKEKLEVEQKKHKGETGLPVNRT